MKKILLSFILVLTIFVTGCDSLMNTPTKKVEKLLSMYQTQSKEVLDQLDNVLLGETLLTSDLKDRYRELLKKQYKDLAYTIKNETIDGNQAIVEVEIEVYDYNSAVKLVDADVLANSNNYLDDSGNVMTTRYNEEKITKMENVKERITYTINFTVSKIDGKWMVDDLTETERIKLHGLYPY